MATQVQNLLLDGGRQVEDMEDNANWALSGSGASKANDTTNFKTGTQSLKLTSVNAVAATLRKTVSYDMSSVSKISFWVYIYDITTMNNAVSTIYFASDTGFTQFYSWTLNTNRFQNGWNKIIIDKSDFSTTSTPTWSSIVRIQLRVLSLAGQTASVSFDDLRFDEFYRPKMCLTFDDGSLTQYQQAWPLMQARGIVGTCFVIGSYIDQGLTPYMTLAQLRVLQANGWLIANHTYNHLNLLTDPDLRSGTTAEQLAKIKNEIQLGINWCINNGFADGAYYLAFPQGGYDDLVLQACSDLGIIACRTTNDLTQVPYTDNRLTMFRRTFSDTVTTTTMKGYTSKMLSLGGVCIPNNHIFENPKTGSTSVLPADFQTFLDDAELYKDNFDYVTFDQLYNQMVGKYTLANSKKNITGGNLISAPDDLTQNWVNNGTATRPYNDVVLLPAANDSIRLSLATGNHASKTYTFSVDLTGSGTVELFISDSAGGAAGTPTVVTLSSTPYRYFVTRTFTSLETGTSTVLNIGRTNSATATKVTVKRMRAVVGYDARFTSI